MQHHNRPPFRLATLGALVAASLALGGCGGGDDNDAENDDIVLSGSVVAAPVSGARCEVRDDANLLLAGPATSAADGGYRIAIDDDHAGRTLRLRCQGGTYVDEATGTTVTAGTLAAHVGPLARGARASVHLSPASTVIEALIHRHGKSENEALTLFEDAFGFRPDLAFAPADANGPATAAGDAELLAGLRAAAFSQLTADLGLTPEQQFDLLAALAEDLADGTLDGNGANGAVTAGTTALPADIRNRFTSALLAFRNSARNQIQLGADALGTLPFSPLALTDSYRIEYQGPAMGEHEGENRFTLKVTDRAAGTAVSGATVALSPMMHMATMTHSTPHTGCSEDAATPGNYDCTVYYLMPSTMANGMSMGYWDVGVTIGTETAHFYPQVAMAMGDTAKVRLRGVTDQIMAMDGTTTSRPYFIFNSGLSAETGGTYAFELFVAAKESMTSFPAITSSTTLNAGTASELAITSVTVEVSSDGGASWITATEQGNGYWLASGLGGLSAGTSAELQVRLTVNGEVKTTNGLAADGTNEAATFTVTPQ